MSLSVKLKQFQIPKCRGEKLAKIEFRGVSHYTKISEDSGNELIIIDQIFHWPVARPVDENELLLIELYLRNRLFSDKLLGCYCLVLQKVVEEGKLVINDTLLDPNNKPLPASIHFEIVYTHPENSSVSFNSQVFDTLKDDQHMLIDVEQNIAVLEHNLLTARLHNEEQNEIADKSPNRGQKRSAAAFKTVRSLIRFGKQRRATSENEDDEACLLQEKTKLTHESAPVSRANSQSSISSNADSQHSLPEKNTKRITRPKSDVKTNIQSILKAQDFQVCITIIEARQLAGLNMDPVVCIQVGDQRKYTSVKESTNCPYYNEYIVFDFHMPPIMMLDKIITLSVLQSRNFLRGNKLLGSFKLDVATVWSQPDHQFYHKWALLTDPDDITGGPKGYLKCDISVIGKGDTVKVPPKSEKDEDDIEANLLLPDGVPLERQRARFIVKIYRADGLPKMNSSLMANMKKALTGESNDLVNPFVQVSFAGLTGKTSVKKHSYAPVWNEQIVFTEMFPPLCQRIKIQLRDNDPVKPTVIGTHFIDLKTISNDGEKGFLPTFGPSFVHLYGSTRDYTLIDEHSGLNAGLGEGVSYRARLLIAIRTEISDGIDLAPALVENEATVPVNEGSYAKNEEFFLFSTILDASMIDKKLADKPIYFEISVGNAGNAIDGHNESVKDHYDSDSDELEIVTSESGSWQSTTTPTKPMTHDKMYYFLPYWDNKPCMHIRSTWPDYRRRMYNSNIIAKITEKLEDGLMEVSSLMIDANSEMETQLKQVLDDLSIGCNKYLTISKATLTSPGTGKTKLDKEHFKLCQRELESIGAASRNLRALVTKTSFKERFKTAHSYLNRLKFLTENPQHALPDVFLWLISGGKRQAYQRIPARDIIFSIVDEESGKDCGKVQTMYLKLPGKKSTGPSGWTVPAKLQIYLWLGVLKHKKYLINGIPRGYEISNEIRNIERPRSLPPSSIHYIKKHIFQLRAHVYQARSLIGSDASGLSDPFARIICGEFCKTTQVIDETLSPTWDELLIFDEILIYGDEEEMKTDPITIIIEIFDQDQVGKSEFIGRASAKPYVKFRSEKYAKPRFPPSLEWFAITRGIDQAGELLATFELLEIPFREEDELLPCLPQVKDIPIYKDTDLKEVVPIFPVPRGIRPTLATFRIEILFWGLRDLKRVHLLTVDKPRVDIECSGHILHSSLIQNAKKNPNFNAPVKFIDLELPEQELYRPPLTIRAVDCRSFGRFTLIGTHIINSIHKCMITPAAKKEDKLYVPNQLKPLEYVLGNQYSFTTLSSMDNKEKTPLLPKDIEISVGYGTRIINKKAENNRKKKHSLLNEDVDNEEEKDWWTKYFASVERMISETKEAKRLCQNGKLQVSTDEENVSPSHNLDKSPVESKKKFGFKTASTASRFGVSISPKSMRKKETYKPALCKVFPTQLENNPEFQEFKEWLHTFKLYRGKKVDDETEDDSRVVGYFKGAIKVYRWPLPKNAESRGHDLQFGFFQGLPSNDPIKVLVRVYIVKANDLHPMDINGKADPYVVLQLGSKRISDKDNYVSKQLNPIFGKCFEIEATFPQDSLLTVQIYDWDLVGSDEMIGETKIDLENRFYSKHRATCGLPEKYEEQGYNAWRDAMKPTQILAKLCKDTKLETPIYCEDQVKIGNQIFTVQCDDFSLYRFVKESEEHMALAVLHRWHEFPEIGYHLVPEHVETRPLYSPDKPGIEQGKLEMWVDMFPMDMPLPGPPLDISPRKPRSYELRVIVWNTDDVVLEDDAFFTGEKMSDIYVKGWLKGSEDCQSTDIHYRSLTGEGNFNWRFIFPFDYLIAEQKIVITRKESLFSWDETECKIPARLELQVWDADHFSADDFLGAITLDLNRFPRGAKSSKLCTLDMLKTDGSVPVVNIFKQKRIKGWWPFFIKRDNEEMELTGKVEAEFHLLPKEEADKNPVGLGRSEPDPLEKPNRPDSSFMWFVNPLKSIRYIIWHNYKWTILKFFIIICLAIIILLFFYSIPGYTVKKLIGA